MPLFGQKRRAAPARAGRRGAYPTPNFIKRLGARRDVRVTAVWDHDVDPRRRAAEQLGARPTAWMRSGATRRSPA